MTIPTSRENSNRPLSTADLAAASRRSPRDRPDETDEVEFDESALDREARKHGREEGDTDDSVRDDSVRDDEIGTADSPGGTAGVSGEESLEPLFAADQAEKYRDRWIQIQSSFVDDPSAAVRAGDELVAEVMTELANSFAEQRHRFESRLDAPGSANTEDLRVALTSYRAFFERLLSL